VSLNLHGIVRGATPTVNPDIFGWWYKSTGSVSNVDGRQVPAYYSPAPVRLQVQPPTWRDLKFIDFLQLQGVIRTVFMFSNPQSIDRVNHRGGDLLLFPQWHCQPNDTWLVARPDEAWDVDEGGWTKLFAVLQTDRLYSSLNTQGQLVLDAEGRIVRTET
jgi:hypothetical protein